MIVEPRTRSTRTASAEVLDGVQAQGDSRCAESGRERRDRRATTGGEFRRQRNARSYAAGKWIRPDLGNPTTKRCEKLDCGGPKTIQNAAGTSGRGSGKYLRAPSSIQNPQRHPCSSTDIASCGLPSRDRPVPAPLAHKPPDTRHWGRGNSPAGRLPASGRLAPDKAAFGGRITWFGTLASAASLL
jgi:hypothetical protein